VLYFSVKYLYLTSRGKRPHVEEDNMKVQYAQERSFGSANSGNPGRFPGGGIGGRPIYCRVTMESVV
jgi:hypothetical protein